jgi:hypothetical protein
VAGQVEIKKAAGDKIRRCEIYSTGVKWTRLRIMYHTDESDLGSADNPPSAGGCCGLNIISVT